MTIRYSMIHNISLGRLHESTHVEPANYPSHPSPPTLHSPVICGSCEIKPSRSTPNSDHNQVSTNIGSKSCRHAPALRISVDGGPRPPTRTTYLTRDMQPMT
ncbi:hypothetical protein BO83DRAFT_85874 [Aspergillus eucalypticola CBS 122712]|uniref:Uncharacterized protein n=1 Tax=Aspergillus eucalypticola (strain CBS 122712 / IBT 29274) TaxID=1448314 RepID=A0A317WDB9_ASPEC|nr:uncharacterized protein BO83DRAFT_85874 [Aspergillus eucalypticola CBS 122712]PWY84363.1 hypothetical protein BO83DRAFT_85874 [Aspergillus eucalypticola CBS 122712]